MGGFDFTDDHHDDIDVDKYARENERYYFKDLFYFFGN